MAKIEAHQLLQTISLERVFRFGDQKGDHAEEMLRWRGTTFITGGAVCGDKWRGPKHGTAEGFGVLTLRPDRVDWRYESYGWKARRPS